MTKHKTKYIVSVISTVFLSILCVQAWNWLTASPWDKLDYQKWNELVASVQSGRIPWEVAAFNLASCPNGWSPYTPAIGRTIIWVWNGAGNNTTLAQNIGSVTAPWYAFTIPGTSSNLTVTATLPLRTEIGSIVTPSWASYLGTSKAWSANVQMFSNTAPTDLSAAYLPLNVSVAWWGIPAQNITIPGSENNMQPSIALLYCVKN